ncbi:MAG: STAS domain-containing protein [Candidatus Margulisiibacteriota bacterium]
MEAIEVKEEKDYVQVDITGDIEEADSMHIERVFGNFILEGYTRFVFNLIETTFVDSAALTMFVLKAKEVNKIDGYIAFLGLTDDCMEIFYITRLTQYFMFFKDEKEMQKAFEKG